MGKQHIRPFEFKDTHKHGAALEPSVIYDGWNINKHTHTFTHTCKQSQDRHTIECTKPDDRRRERGEEVMQRKSVWGGRGGSRRRRDQGRQWGRSEGERITRDDQQVEDQSIGNHWCSDYNPLRLGTLICCYWGVPFTLHCSLSVYKNTMAIVLEEIGQIIPVCQLKPVNWASCSQICCIPGDCCCCWFSI